MIRVEDYIDKLGRSRFQEWRLGLDAVTRLRVDRAIDRLTIGHEANLKTVGTGIVEMKLYFGPGYRIYFGRRAQDWIILLTGGSKDRQSRDIELAQRLWKECVEEA